MMRFAALAVAIWACGVPALAQGIDAATQAQLDQVARLGREINDHDQSAWHVTDALMALRPDPPKGAAVGYITERIDPLHVKTTFMLTENGETREYFSGIVEGSKVLSVENFIADRDAPKATPEQKRQLDARAGLGDAFGRRLCGKPVNTVAIPVEDEPGALDIYALASETEEGMIQFGGHVKVRIGADGEPEGKIKGFANSCIALSATGDGRVPDGAEFMLVITLPEEFGDVPTEIHVFKSLSHGVPLFVATKTRLWKVDGDKINLSDAKLPR
jgi:hypothetical protein